MVNNTSFYLYSQSIIEKQIDLLNQCFPQYEFLYSIKTNPFELVLKHIFSKGLGADAASSSEVLTAIKHDVDTKDIFYSAPGKTKEDIEKTMDLCTIIADSYTELKLINDMAKEKKKHVSVGIRINPDFSMDGETGWSSKFGVDEETLIDKREFLNSLSNISIIGIHVHLRSQILSKKTLLRYYKKIFDLSQFCISSLGWNLQFINFGGGLGVPYDECLPLDVFKLGNQCDDLRKQYSDLKGIRLIIETGRFVICKAGKYFSPIVDIKESRGKKYLIIKNGLNGFMRPAIAELLKSFHGIIPDGFSAEPMFTSFNPVDITILGKEGIVKEKVDVVGNLCTSTDILASDIMLPKAEIGDMVVLSNAGSYAYTLTPVLFSSQPMPLEVFQDYLGNFIINNTKQLNSKCDILE